MADLLTGLREHYRAHWGEFTEHTLGKGPVHELQSEFAVLRFAPREDREAWTYATCGMAQTSAPCEHQRVEVFVLAPHEDESLVELLTIIAWFHANREALGLGHTVNFGRPWHAGSQCDHGLLSLPHLDRPSVGLFGWQPEVSVQVLWLIPITMAERDFKIAEGLDALEDRFEQTGLHYLDPFRDSVVSRRRRRWWPRR
ncbi:MAG: suppressor of fused domain protein [Micrococcales bacterium]|nr:suppressor of fused domain protein [Micrococcales bacterium]